MGRLQDKVTLITGASRGIGRAIAEAVAQEGAHVAINYVSQAARAEEVAQQIRDWDRSAITVRADVSDREQVEAMVQMVSSTLGPIDVLVNNAGVESIVPFLELDDVTWQQVVDVNLKGEWLCAQVVARRLVAEGRPGAIVNIGSVQAGMALPGRSHYAPTKRGLEALTRNLAAELAPHGIRVNCVHPGLIDTDMTQWVMADPEILPVVLDKIPLHRAGSPREIGPAVVFFASDDASFVTGQSLYVDGGMVIV
ncbi:MAG: glucose 1-dehydrogenase [Thermomicrobiales bacterium]|jgi:glucose 1-dehydrogenase/3-oxoacyl-[acyl-carrier protein] reductase|nr:glucose 1-dehydrogenase [Thermomicrobiales bacterium]